MSGKRTCFQRVLLGALVFAMSATAVSSRAQRREPQPRETAVTIRAPARLMQGDRAEILVDVRVEAASRELPLILTPTSEGTALEVVRGRLFRAEGEPRDDGVLQFRIPVIAREAGTAVFRAQVRTFSCTTRCAAVTLSGRALINVEPSAAPP